IGAGTHFTGGTFATGSSSSASALFPPTFFALGGNASYELDLFGRVRSLTTQARETYFAPAEARRAAALPLVRHVATQYLTERSLAEQYQLAVRTELTTRQTYQLTKDLYDEGQRSDLELRATEAQWERARAQVPHLLRQWQQTVNALVLLIGQPLPAN